MSCLLIRPDAVRGQPWSAEIHLRFPISCDHVIILKFSSPFRIITSHKLVVMSYADGSGGPFSRPARLRRARSPVRTSPLASELPLTCSAVLLTNQCLPVPDAARPPEGHWRAHPAAAPCRPHAPRRGIGVRTRQRHLAAAALTALVVRRVKGGTTLLMYRVNGLGDQPMPASASRPHVAGCTPYFLTSFRISLRA